MKPAFLFLAACLPVPALLRAESLLVYIGTYTDTTYLGLKANTSSQGIYVVRLDTEKGSFSAPVLAVRARNSSSLALHPTLPVLYATEEFLEGYVGAYSIDFSSGRLHLLNRQPIGAVKPLCLDVEPTGRMVVAADYGRNNVGAGNVSAIPIQADGSLGRVQPAIEQHGPSGPIRPRQDFSHPHSTTFSPDGRFALVCDLGLDRVFIYRLDPAHASLQPNDPPYGISPPGSGPRHCEFSADGRFLYVVNELSGSVSHFDWDAARGALELCETYPNLPAGTKETNNPAEIHLHPNGRFLYACNRGPESITVFARDSRSGALLRIQVIGCGGRFPHQFALTPDGRWLICANQHSDNVSLFRIDPFTGRLSPTSSGLRLASPSWALVLPLRAGAPEKGI